MDRLDQFFIYIVKVDVSEVDHLGAELPDGEILVVDDLVEQMHAEIRHEGLDLKQLRFLETHEDFSRVQIHFNLVNSWDDLEKNFLLLAVLSSELEELDASYDILLEL